MEGHTICGLPLLSRTKTTSTLSWHPCAKTWYNAKTFYRHLFRINIIEYLYAVSIMCIRKHKQGHLLTHWPMQGKPKTPAIHEPHCHYRPVHQFPGKQNPEIGSGPHWTAKWTWTIEIWSWKQALKILKGCTVGFVWLPCHVCCCHTCRRFRHNHRRH